MPSGEIVATPERGTLLGNRGLLHDCEGRIVRPWREKRWIACVLDCKGRRRTVRSPGRYTELFFLDEATALAAGHRPCAECRRGQFDAFRDARLKGNGGAAPVTAGDIDRRLHAERLGPGGTKRTFQAALDELSDGVFVRLPGDERPWLLCTGRPADGQAGPGGSSSRCAAAACGAAGQAAFCSTTR
jgi:hypothetical protein